MGADSSELFTPSGLALPPLDSVDHDDDELTDYALAIEPSTPPARAITDSVASLLPSRPMPVPLRFRTSTGSTPPPRRVQADSPSISWRKPVESEEETAPTIELNLRRDREPLERRQVTLRGPTPMPPRVPTPQPLPLQHPPQVVPTSVRRSRLAVSVIFVAGVLLGAVAGVLCTLYLAS